MVILVLILFGLAFGSFVNALVWRTRQQELASKKSKVHKVKKWQPFTLNLLLSTSQNQYSILAGRSMCPNCRHQLAVKDLVPVVSWLLLKGKCRYCHKPISVQYPLVELATVALFVFSYSYWPPALSGVGLFEFIVWLAILVGFIALAVYDIRWFLLPNKLVYPLGALVLLQLIITVIWKSDASLLLGALWGVLVLGGGFYGLFIVSKGQWIGGGDVRLGVLLGLVIGGPLMSLLLLLLASLGGTVISLPLLAVGKAKAKSKVPFGPFLLAAAVVVELFGTGIIHWYKNHLF